MRNKGIAAVIALVILAGAGLILYYYLSRGQVVRKPATLPSALAPAPQAEEPAPSPAKIHKITPAETPAQVPPAPDVQPPLKEGPPPSLTTPAPPALPPAASTMKVPPTAEAKEYAVLVGTFRSYRSARKIRDKLQQQGIPAYTRLPAGGTRVHQVWAGPFETMAQAREASRKIRAKLGKSVQVRKVRVLPPK